MTYTFPFARDDAVCTCNASFGGLRTRTQRIVLSVHIPQFAWLPPKHGARFPTVLQAAGVIIPVGFSDASLPPDGRTADWNDAGLGVFLDLRAPPLACLVHMQANVRVSSVLMAELAAVLLGVKAAALLLGHSFVWASDSLLAVRYMTQDLSQVPWRLRPILSELHHLQARHHFQMIKIPRAQNSEAHRLAVAAKRRHLGSVTDAPSMSCVVQFHSTPCNVLFGINSVSWGSLRLSSVLCS
ncbi:uncharacterized protein C2845_PM03G20750 [Panicum miliaceum]|uniref:RNase H type-1 domain-containing protein n=1 Tax=Panicum miliaceum TaxID=4540 RepID=A0A3L6T681_PANMI|nr:uncharacterized protein C2845_PM03G20750 [Panicum miliaceum]